MADLAGLKGEALEEALGARLARRPVAEWVAALTAAGIGAHRCVPSLVELMQDPLTVSRGLAVTRDHEGFGPMPCPEVVGLLNHVREVVPCRRLPRLLRLLIPQLYLRLVGLGPQRFGIGIGAVLERMPQRRRVPGGRDNRRGRKGRDRGGCLVVRHAASPFGYDAPT